MLEISENDSVKGYLKFSCCHVPVIRFTFVAKLCYKMLNSVLKVSSLWVLRPILVVKSGSKSLTLKSGFLWGMLKLRKVMRFSQILIWSV